MSPLDLDRPYAEQWEPFVRLGDLHLDDLGAAGGVVQAAFVSLYRRQDSLRNGYAASAYPVSNTPLNCPFCASGQAGLTRNLSAAEIVEQVVAAARSLRDVGLAGGR